MWSAAVDPRVLTVRAIEPMDGDTRLFDAVSADARIMRGAEREHLLINRDGELVRLDVVEGTMTAGPVVLRFDLADDDRFDLQADAIRSLRFMAAPGRRHLRLAGRLFALQAVDARDAGASLRETADILLGPGAWPGDGEHRKSYVRRLLDAGSRMISSGHREILNTH